VLVLASAFPPHGGARASPFAKTLLEGSCCPRLLLQHLQTPRISAAAEPGMLVSTGERGGEDCSSAY